MPAWKYYGSWVDNQGYPYIWPSHCKDSQKISLKLYSIVTHFVNFKHNFHKEIETFFKNKLKWIQEKCFKMNPLSSELPFHVHNSLIISLKDFCIVIRKWPTFWPSSSWDRISWNWGCTWINSKSEFSETFLTFYHAPPPLKKTSEKIFISSVKYDLKSVTILQPLYL